MSQPPRNPKIYHITHVANLPSIVNDGFVYSDALMIERGGPSASIGMNAIKAARLTRSVPCHGNYVGDYVPFNYCPRSVMLYLIYRANHPDLTYRGGQGPIVHLEADLRNVIDWARRQECLWALSPQNARAEYTTFHSQPNDFDKIMWEDVANPDFRQSDVRENKQAELLVHGRFPWALVERVGVRSIDILDQTHAAVRDAAHVPKLEIIPEWYF
jgi:hypothetical protein